ncbi:MAG: TrkH family potassium uptake protein [Thermoguttaceae bacterium]|nr:TrkH family potassium uptake protein [Thermoguttaceae bacterium]
MNFRLIFRFLGIVAFIMAGGMLLALPWGSARFGGDWVCERAGVAGLSLSIVTSIAVGLTLLFFGRKADPVMLRKDSLAIVPLSWLLAIFLAALPYLFSGVQRAPDVKMSVSDAIFESASGLTTTGATILTDLESPELVPRTILFWRAMTHFMGGLGIMVFLVAILGYGTAGKKIMLLETGGAGGTWSHYRQFALVMAAIYMALIAVMAILLYGLGVSAFDSICHAFSTLATGGFSTFNASIGHFAAETDLNASLIEFVVIFFMFLGGVNFVLLYYLIISKPKDVIRDVEFRTYVAIIVGVTLIVFFSGMVFHDFDTYGTTDSLLQSKSKLMLPLDAFRQSLFQVVSIMTTTGFVTDEFEKWNGISLLLFLMVGFIGGCVGGTAGGAKVGRIAVSVKTFRLELEKVYRPNVVRTKQLGSVTLDDSTLYGVVAYLFFLVVTVALVTLAVLILEPPTLWTEGGEPARLLDLFSSSLSMVNNVGPGFGVLGARQNYACLAEITKLVYSFAMFAGRLDLYLPLLICSPTFWKR